MKYKVFISQPMNGKSDQFIKGERELAKQEIFGMKDRIKKIHKVDDVEIEVLDSYFEDFNEVELDEVNVPLFYLSKALEVLSKADGAYFAYGWKNTRGCKIEHDCAVEYDIDILKD